MVVVSCVTRLNLGELAGMEEAGEGEMGREIGPSDE